jgi:hypothetical protein
MKSILLSSALLLALAPLPSCTVPYQAVSGSHVASAENFSVDLPDGWRQHNASADPLQKFTAILEKRHKLSWDVLRLTRDGLLLQQICIGRIPIAEELPNTKRKLLTGMSPFDAAELINDNLRANPQLTHQELIENAPATVSGYPGFRLHYSYRAEDRLKMEGIFYGALVERWLYYALYEAPAQHYFGKDLPVFEETVSSLAVGPAAVQEPTAETAAKKAKRTWTRVK